MAVNIPESSLIACICEGGAETAIMDILLNNDLLVFKREQLYRKYPDGYGHGILHQLHL